MIQHQLNYVAPSFKQIEEEISMVNIPKYTMELDESSSNEANCSTDTFLSSCGSDYKMADNLSVNGDASESDDINMKLPYHDKTSSSSSSSSCMDDEKCFNEEEEEIDIDPDRELTQEEISALLGEDDIYNDFLNELFEQEKVSDNNAMSWYVAELAKDADFLYYRKYALDWIRETAIELKLLPSTIFRANYYFDKLASMKQMNHKWLKFVAAVCLWIACKFDEIDYNIPCLETMLHFLPRELRRNYHHLASLVLGTEMKVLKALDFKLKTVLPIDFIQFYIYSANENQEGVLFEDESAEKNEIERISVFLLHLIAENYSFYKYPSSVIAMSVICAARRALNISPYFNPKLVQLCRYTESQIQPCFDKLWNDYCQKFPNKVPKH